MQLAELAILDVIEHFVQPFFRIYVVLFTGGKEGVEHGFAPGRFMRAGKQVVIPSDGDGPDAVYHQVVVALYFAVRQVQAQVFPAIGGILNGFADGACRGHLVILNLEPLAQ